MFSSKCFISQSSSVFCSNLRISTPHKNLQLEFLQLPCQLHRSFLIANCFEEVKIARRPLNHLKVSFADNLEPRKSPKTKALENRFLSTRRRFPLIFSSGFMIFQQFFIINLPSVASHAASKEKRFIARSLSIEKTFYQRETAVRIRREAEIISRRLNLPPLLFIADEISGHFDV
jgi:hypothetical protein